MAVSDEGGIDMFYAVVITGASRETTEDDVRKFFSDSLVREVLLPANGGGEASWRTTSNTIFVRLETAIDFENACRKDGQILRSQKVGVLTVTRQDYEKISGGSGGGASSEPVPLYPPTSTTSTNSLLTTNISYPPPLLSSTTNNNSNTTSSQPPIGREGEEDCLMVRLRGLPYSAMASDILDFLKNVKVTNGEKGVHFSFGYDGRVTGEAYVEVCGPEDVERALKYDRCHLGGRYIEIFRATQSQFEWDCRPGDHSGGVGGPEGSGGSKGGVVRLRGLPYGCSREDIRDFLQGIPIVDGGITIQTNENGRETGEAFIELVNEDDVERALDRHKKLIGHRYIEVFRTTHGDIKPVADRWAKYSRPSPYPTGGGGGRGRGRGGGGGGHYEGHTELFHRGAGYKFGGGVRGGSWGDYEQERGRYVTTTKLAPRHDPLGSYYHADRYGGGGGGGGGQPSNHMVRLRGVPYATTEQDIYDFFSPLVPLRVNLDKDHFGRALGEGEIFFQSHEDAQNAMKKDRQNIGSRYVELFLHSKPAPYGGNNWNHGPPTDHQSTGGYGMGGAPAGPGTSYPSTYYVAAAPAGTTPYQPYSAQGSSGPAGGGWY